MKHFFPLALLLALFTVSSRAQATESAPREVVFRVVAPCECAACVFDMRRVLGKFEGVHKITLDTKHKRLTLQFEESKHSVSQLAQAFSALDLGEKSSLLWPLPLGEAANKEVENLTQISGVKNAVADSKTGQILLTFNANPAVSLAQLDAATLAANS